MVEEVSELAMLTCVPGSLMLGIPDGDSVAILCYTAICVVQ